MVQFTVRGVLWRGEGLAGQPVRGEVVAGAEVRSCHPAAPTTSTTARVSRCGSGLNGVEPAVAVLGTASCVG